MFSRVKMWSFGSRYYCSIQIDWIPVYPQISLLFILHAFVLRQSTKLTCSYIKRCHCFPLLEIKLDQYLKDKNAGDHCRLSHHFLKSPAQVNHTQWQIYCLKNERANGRYMHNLSPQPWLTYFKKGPSIKFTSTQREASWNTINARERTCFVIRQRKRTHLFCTPKQKY